MYTAVYLETNETQQRWNEVLCKKKLRVKIRIKGIDHEGMELMLPPHQEGVFGYPGPVDLEVPVDSSQIKIARVQKQYLYMVAGHTLNNRSSKGPTMSNSAGDYL